MGATREGSMLLQSGVLDTATRGLKLIWNNTEAGEQENFRLLPRTHERTAEGNMAGKLQLPTWINHFSVHQADFESD